METLNSDSYTPLVEIKDFEDFRLTDDDQVFGDRRDGKLYRYTPELKLSINVALATGRPLLVLGPTGCGKSSLAFNLARLMGRRYYEFVVTSRSQARDLFYKFDAVRRLGDAQIRDSTKINETTKPIWHDKHPYVEPGALWWAFDRKTASRRGYPGEGEVPFSSAVDPAVWVPDTSEGENSLLLIDEIDKAEPDFPNNLLVPLGSFQFTVEEIAAAINLRDDRASDNPMAHPFVIITSNGERELPDTFLRRCIVMEIARPTVDQLVELATKVFNQQDDEFFRDIALQLVSLHGEERLSSAEFLDAVRATQKLRASKPAMTEIIKRSAWRSTEP